MENVWIVFFADIIREERQLNNNLYELLEVVPAKPSLVARLDKSTSCDFIPKTDKVYVPKKKTKLKVKTVRNVRELLEKDVYGDLHAELEKHKNLLLRKIKIGSSREEATKKLAKRILRSSSPICKDLWQMLTNLNPEGHSHSAQFVLWNHKPIQINGSTGGKNKFICNFDVGQESIRNLNKSFEKSSNKSRRNKILHNSLHIKFKPGPLSKKKYLDTSYQKFQYGDSTIVSLPKPGLDVQPLYGTPLSSSMINFLGENFMRTSDGEITNKWAEFSLSALGINKKGSPVQSDKSACISFDLLYKCNQNRILMRDGTGNKDREISSQEYKQPLSTTDEVDTVLNKILDYVEIKLDEENFHTKEDQSNPDLSDLHAKPVIVSKDKVKKKFCELDRLDVTVIKLSGPERENTKCVKDYCSLGCICSSLECSFNFKTHCGRIECMFECKCINSKQWFSTSDSFNFSGLKALNKKLNSGLAKEEQKFRQTIVLSGEKSILLKSQRRNWKSSKRYAEFYSSMCLKTESESKKVLVILVPKITCDNIEPWCMVHNLYKCFCKGKFTERKSFALEEKEMSPNVMEVTEPTDENIENPVIEPPKTRSSLRLCDNNKNSIVIEDDEHSGTIVRREIHKGGSSRCARVKPYTGKKYTDEYYLKTNRKISEMEKNDRTLLKKLANLMQIDIEKQKPQQVQSQNNEKTSNEIVGFSKQFFKQLPYNPKMIAWMIACYKHCKKRKNQGKIERFLKPPHEMRIGFYTWEFILSRYCQRKNFFFLSPQTPYKIFIAINNNHPKLRSYINIRDLNPSSIQIYPNEVQNLFNNLTERKDTFWILRGLSHCWELYGVVKKLNDQTGDDDIVCSLKCDENETLEFNERPLNICYGFSDDEYEESMLENNDVDVEREINIEPILLTSDDDQLVVNDDRSSNLNNVIKNKDNLSKWYLMIVENDFKELHFYKRGFFVQHDHVIQAINVSQKSNKTVKLYCQKHKSNNEELHFGIYAIPNKSRDVVVGPYEPDEPLGMEIVKANRSTCNSTTRGTWIAVDKENISKLMDEPLSFVPPNIQREQMIPLDREIAISKENNTRFPLVNSTPKLIKSQTKTNNPDAQTKTPAVSKPIKPIKIRKSDGFYCVYPNLVNSSQGSQLAIIPKSCLSKPLPAPPKLGAGINLKSLLKPVDEIAPQTETSENKSRPSRGRGMSVLKPEEINKRILEQSLAGSSNDDPEIDKDIENFLATTSICTLRDEEDEILLISDEETEDVIENVWIQSKNVSSLGWIPGKLNKQGQISFEFPGFKYTNFYQKDVAFRMINLIFSRKVFVHERFNIEWEIVEDFKYIKMLNKLESSDLNTELVLTKHGLKTREELVEKSKKRKLLKNENNKTKKRKLLTMLEQGTDDLGNNTNDVTSNKEDMMQSITHAGDDERQEMVDKLSFLLSDTDSQ